MNDAQRKNAITILIIAAVVVVFGPQLIDKVPGGSIISKPQDFTGCQTITVTQSGGLTTEQDILTDTIRVVAEAAGTSWRNYDADQPAGKKFLAMVDEPDPVILIYDPDEAKVRKSAPYMSTKPAIAKFFEVPNAE